MFCTKCGTVLHEGNRFCTKCGEKIATWKEDDLLEQDVNLQQSTEEEEVKSDSQTEEDACEVESCDEAKLDNDEKPMEAEADKHNYDAGIDSHKKQDDLSLMDEGVLTLDELEKELFAEADAGGYSRDTVPSKGTTRIYERFYTKKIEDDGERFNGFYEEEPYDKLDIDGEGWLLGSKERENREPYFYYRGPATYPAAKEEKQEELDLGKISGQGEFDFGRISGQEEFDFEKISGLGEYETDTEAEQSAPEAQSQSEGGQAYGGHMEGIENNAGSENSQNSETTENGENAEYIQTDSWANTDKAISLEEATERSVEPKEEATMIYTNPLCGDETSSDWKAEDSQNQDENRTEKVEAVAPASLEAEPEAEPEATIPETQVQPKEEAVSSDTSAATAPDSKKEGKEQKDDTDSAKKKHRKVSVSEVLLKILMVILIALIVFQAALIGLCHLAPETALGQKAVNLTESMVQWVGGLFSSAPNKDNTEADNTEESLEPLSAIVSATAGQYTNIEEITFDNSLIYPNGKSSSNKEINDSKRLGNAVFYTDSTGKNVTYQEAVIISTEEHFNNWQSKNTNSNFTGIQKLKLGEIRVKSDTFYSLCKVTYKKADGSTLDKCYTVISKAVEQKIEIGTIKEEMI